MNNANINSNWRRLGRYTDNDKEKVTRSINETNEETEKNYFHNNENNLKKLNLVKSQSGGYRSNLGKQNNGVISDSNIDSQFKNKLREEKNTNNSENSVSPLWMQSANLSESTKNDQTERKDCA
eukprot:Pgem_evm1s14117